MAIPVLYWMLECTGCGSRRVVYDSYLQFVGTSEPHPPPGAGYGGPPLPERYPCTKGCSRPMKAIGSISEPDDEEMWLHEPHVPVKLTKAQSNEGRQLIQAAGFPGGEERPPNKRLAADGAGRCGIMRAFGRRGCGAAGC